MTMTPDQQIHQANRARELLQNTTLNAALDQIASSAVSAWRTSGYLKTEEREMAYLRIKAVDELRSTLNRMIADGDLARISTQQT